MKTIKENAELLDLRNIAFKLLESDINWILVFCDHCKTEYKCEMHNISLHISKNTMYDPCISCNVYLNDYLIAYEEKKIIEKDDSVYLTLFNKINDDYITNIKKIILRRLEKNNE